jgi:hypothetical protein
MFTIFSVPKAFTGPTAVRQRNAIISWMHLRPQPEILLLGDDAGTAELSAELGLRHIPSVERNEHGTPLVSSVFERAQGASTYERLCYVNADIILVGDMSAVVRRVRRTPCLVVGRRTDFDLAHPIDFDGRAWETTLLKEVARRGVVHSHRGMDYFLFPRGFWPHMPPFAVGRLMWDNWLVFDARRRGQRVVDATRVLTAIHQNHGYALDIVAPSGGWHWDHPETRRNLELAGGHPHNFNIHDATHVLSPAGLWPALGPEYLRQRLRRPPFEPWTPTLKTRVGRRAIEAGLRLHRLFDRAVRVLRARAQAFEEIGSEGMR